MSPTVPPGIILASASPRRRELIEAAGMPCTVIPSSVPEALLPGESPPAFAHRLARQKALDVSARLTPPLRDGRPVLGADTIVVIDDQILGKPEGRAAAAHMLQTLSGRTHKVLTAFCLLFADGREHLGCVHTDVTFRVLCPAEISAYLDRGGWEDKAGAYAIQSTAASMVRRVSGSVTNVIGLPLCEVIEALKGAS